MHVEYVSVQLEVVVFIELHVKFLKPVKLFPHTREYPPAVVQLLPTDAALHILRPRSSVMSGHSGAVLWGEEPHV